MAANYILQDRSNANKWAIQITNGEFLYEITTGTAQDEPIFEDRLNSGTYFKLFISDSEIAVEPTETTRDDEVHLRDTTLGGVWRLFVRDEQLGYELSGYFLKEANIFVFSSAANVTMFNSALETYTYPVKSNASMREDSLV